jgi:hypothetical protein
MLERRLQDALVEVARRFAAADVDYCLGGSLMLRLCGYEVAVGDIDVYVSADVRRPVTQALRGLDVKEVQGSEPWRTRWLLRTELETGSGSVGLDVMGGLALVIDGEVTRFPATAQRHVEVGDQRVPLGDVAAWYHLYRVHHPARAAVVAGLLSDDEIMGAAQRLSIDHVFSPTLIVRIGTGSALRSNE